MAEPALRAVAVAGVLAAGLLLGGAPVPAHAQPSDSDGSSQDGGSESPGGGSQSNATDSDGSDAGDNGSSANSDPVPGENTGGGTDLDDNDNPSSSGGSTGSADSGGSGGSGGGSTVAIDPAPQESGKTGYANSITIPMFRLPAVGEIPAGSWPTASTFLTTIQIPVPTFQEFLSALRIVPTPAPPGPAFRTQEESPVIDATTGTTGGGGAGAGGGSEARVFQAPLVTVPRAMTVAGGAPRVAIETPAGPVAQPGVTQPGVAGARTPVIRGSVAPTPGAASVPESSPMAGQAPPARAGFPRFMRSPTVTELAVVALPGLAGLILLTFGGGLIGYRQANSARFVRTAGAERFLP